MLKLLILYSIDLEDQQEMSFIRLIKLLDQENIVVLTILVLDILPQVLSKLLLIIKIQFSVNRMVSSD